MGHIDKVGDSAEEDKKFKNLDSGVDNLVNDAFLYFWIRKLGTLYINSYLFQHLEVKWIRKLGSNYGFNKLMH